MGNKYDCKPTIELDEEGHGRVILIREGQKLVYNIGEKIKFDSFASRGLNGESVWPGFLKDGFKYVSVISKEHKKARQTI